MAKHKITFFTCGNGDASLIEAHGFKIMTDINYRQAATDEEEDEISDFAPKIRKACDDDKLSIFVLTHPDADHLRGFDEIFHLGKPEDRENDPEKGCVKIIVDEIWCSPYAISPNYKTEESKPLLNEIKRRQNLVNKPEGKKDGNRLRILSVTNNTTNGIEKLVSGLEFFLLAPTKEEATIPKTQNGASENSSNPSSLVIQWRITVGMQTSKVIIGGDSTVDVWERIGKDFEKYSLEWHILLAPHHCSRYTLGRKDTLDGKDDFSWSKEAFCGLNHPASSKAHVVSSSRKFGSTHPPHPKARERYYKMLASGSAIDSNVRTRFKVTAGKKGEASKDVVFNFTSKGPTLAALVGAPIIPISSTSQGGGYGNR